MAVGCFQCCSRKQEVTQADCAGLLLLAFCHSSVAQPQLGWTRGHCWAACESHHRDPHTWDFPTSKPDAIRCPHCVRRGFGGGTQPAGRGAEKKLLKGWGPPTLSFSPSQALNRIPVTLFLFFPLLPDAFPLLQSKAAHPYPPGVPHRCHRAPPSTPRDAGPAIGGPAVPSPGPSC